MCLYKVFQGCLIPYPGLLLRSWSVENSGKSSWKLCSLPVAAVRNYHKHGGYDNSFKVSGIWKSKSMSRGWNESRQRRAHLEAEGRMCALSLPASGGCCYSLACGSPAPTRACLVHGCLLLLSTLRPPLCEEDTMSVFRARLDNPE